MTDAEPFEAFVRRYQDMVFATAVRLLGNVSDAEDAAQTVFLRAFERYSQLAGHPGAGGWLKTATRNLCFNHLSRYRARWKFFSELDAPGGDTTFESTLESQVSRALGIEAADQHAPAGPVGRVQLVHLERDIGVVGAGDQRARVGADTNHVAVERVVHGDDKRVAVDHQTEPPDGAAGQEPIAVCAGQRGHLHGGVHDCSFRRLAPPYEGRASPNRDESQRFSLIFAALPRSSRR